MREYITRCDRCGNGIHALSFSVNIERYVGASGNGETKTAQFDLCANCEHVILSDIFNSFEFDHDVRTKLKKYLGFEPKVYD